jgi:alkanesulfonate monooxygenase SsuD/methylene tetrahydromethanopterin reductase-like flavin-dependent oxidoreductase (luciferase family)
LAARYADACNLFGDAQTVARKRGVLADHCVAAGRNPAEVRITHLSTAVVAESRRELNATVDRLRVEASSPEQAAARWGAGTVDDHIGRYRQLAEAGVQTAIVALPDAYTPGALETFAQVITAFEPHPPAAPW